MRAVAVAREPVGWSFVSAVGAGLLVGVVVELLLLAVYPMLFPPTREQPVVIPARDLWEGSAALAAGAVAMRAGGPRAVALYVLFELALVAAQIPARVFSCSRTLGLAGGFPTGFPSPCDYTTLITSRWYFWVALFIGVVIARAIATRDGSNTVLRAAGVLGVASAIALSLALAALYAFFAPAAQGGSVFMLEGPGGFFIATTDVPTYALALGDVIGGAYAGALLARRSLAAPMLIALLLVAPSFALGLPLWRGQTGMPPTEPLGFWLVRMSWLWTPLVGSLAVFVGWAVARRRAGTLRLARQ